MTPLPDGRTLVLAGAGGFGRETLRAALACIERGHGRWDAVVFADDRTELRGSTIDGAPVLGPIEAVIEGSEAEVIITSAKARGTPGRREIAARAHLTDERWAVVIHPDASLAPDTVVGRGTAVLARTVATADVVIGSHVALMPGCVLTHDVVIGDYATLASGVCLGGGVVVGAEAYLGAGALVREGCRIGGGALVGMGAVVLQDIPAGEVWVGNPARRLRVARHADEAGLVAAR